MIPSMTPKVVHEFLFDIGTNWSGKGVAMELGSWLGASSFALLTGLVKAGYSLKFWAFDKWIATEYEVLHAKNQGVNISLGENLRYLYLHNVEKIYDEIIAIQGKIPQTLKSFPGDPIEICLFDAPKKDPTFSASIHILEEFFIPGMTVLGLLDYYSYRKQTGAKRDRLEAPVRYMSANSDKYEKLAEWPEECSCVFFKYVGNALDSE